MDAILLFLGFNTGALLVLGWLAFSDWRRDEAFWLGIRDALSFEFRYIRKLFRKEPDKIDATGVNLNQEAPSASSGYPDSQIQKYPPATNFGGFVHKSDCILCDLGSKAINVVAGNESPIHRIMNENGEMKYIACGRTPKDNPK